MLWLYNESMPNIQIKNVPDEVHAVFRRRAGEAGQSLQEYLLAHLKATAAKPTVAELMARLDEAPDTGSRIAPRDAARLVREDRDAR